MAKKDPVAGFDFARADATSKLIPAVHFIIIFLCSLLAACLLYGMLKSTGAVANKTFQLGGAAAGFVIIFWQSSSIFGSLLSHNKANDQTMVIAKKQEKIEELDRAIERLQAGELPPVICPKGFMPMVSRDDGLAIARPIDWAVHPEKIVATFLRPLTSAEFETLKFRGNIVVTATPFNEADRILIDALKHGDGGELDIDLLLKAPALSAMELLSGGDLEAEPYQVGAKRGLRCRGFYPRPQVPGGVNCLDCVTVADETTGRLFIFALHECEEFVEDSREAFLSLVSSVTFLV